MWHEEPLGELCTPRKGKNTTLSEWVKDGYLPYLGAGQISGAPIEAYACVDGGVICNDDDILILWDGERSGLVGYGNSGVVSSTAAKLVVNKKINSEYLYYFLSEKFSWIQNQRTGTGVPHVPKDLAKILSIRYPKEELAQKKIALILRSADAAIEKTQALTAKYENIKQGMMQDLFTRGVDENVQLRPSYEEAPHLYQETELGWIPKDWDCSDISMYLEPSDGVKPGPFGSSIKKDMYTSSGYRVYGQEQVIAGTLNVGDYYISPTKYSEMSVFSVRAGDVLVSLVGTIGHVLVIPEEYEEGVINPRLMRFRVNKKCCDPYFLRFLLLDSSVSQQLERFATGGTMPVLSGKIFKKVRVPIIPKVEQSKINEVLNGTEAKLLTLSRELNKLVQVKSGLMQDLLTGKVRVAEDIEECKEAVA